MRASGPGWNRFDGVSRPVAIAVLALLGLLMACGVAIGVGPDHATVVDSAARNADGLAGDHALYARIAHRVAAGESYYSAAAAEHRAGNYPLRPFVTVRLPTLAWLFAALGERNVMILFLMLGGATLFAWYRRLRIETDLPRYAAIGALFVAANLTQLAAEPWILIHEVVAGTLIALALALDRRAPVGAVLVTVAAAVAVRETALPVAMLFGLFALIDRDWRAAAGWMTLGLCFIAGIALHIAALAAVTSPADAASQGWHGMGGWTAYLSFVQMTSALRFFQGWVCALLVPLALLGWAAWRSRLGLAGFLVQTGYAALLMIFARPSNFYWAMLVVPSLFVGLVFAPAAIAALLRSLRPVSATTRAVTA